MLGCWSCTSYISLHHRLYLKKALTKSFLFSFHLLPLILSAPGMHKTCCFSVCWCSPKFTVQLEMWWPDSHPLCPYLVWSLIWERYFFTSVTLVCELRSLNASNTKEVSGSWVWEWAVAMLSDSFSASAFQHAVLVAEAHALMDQGGLNLSLADVLVKGKSSASFMEFSVKKLEQKRMWSLLTHFNSWQNGLQML